MASFEELLDAFDYINGHVENEAYLCLKTGKIYFYSELSDDEEPLPDDIDSAERYAAIPDSRDLGLGKPLVFRFVAATIPDDLQKVEEIFSRPGAYARYKDLLEHRGVLDQWYAFERESQERELRDWCEAEGIEIEE